MLGQRWKVEVVNYSCHQSSSLPASHQANSSCCAYWKWSFSYKKLPSQLPRKQQRRLVSVSWCHLGHCCLLPYQYKFSAFHKIPWLRTSFGVWWCDDDRIKCVHLPAMPQSCNEWASCWLTSASVTGQYKFYIGWRTVIFCGGWKGSHDMIEINGDLLLGLWHYHCVLIAERPFSFQSLDFTLTLVFSALLPAYICLCICCRLLPILFFILFELFLSLHFHN